LGRSHTALCTQRLTREVNLSRHIPTKHRIGLWGGGGEMFGRKVGPDCEQGQAYIVNVQAKVKGLSPARGDQGVGASLGGKYCLTAQKKKSGEEKRGSIPSLVLHTIQAQSKRGGTFFYASKKSKAVTKTNQPTRGGKHG